jgi:hypothetical protein
MSRPDIIAANRLRGSSMLSSSDTVSRNAWTVPSAQKDLPGLRMQPRNEKFFTLFSKAGSNVVESAAILMEFVAAPQSAGPSSPNACSTPSTPATTPLKLLTESRAAARTRAPGRR